MEERDIVGADRLGAGTVYEIEQALDRAFADVERDRGVIVPRYVRDLLRNTAIESVALSQEHGRLNLEAPIEYESVIESTTRNASRLLGNAQPEVRAGEAYLTLTAVEREMAAAWCDIFPFCLPI